MPEKEHSAEPGLESLPTDREAMDRFILERRERDAVELHYALAHMSKRQHDIVAVIFQPNHAIRETLRGKPEYDIVASEVTTIEQRSGIPSRTRLAMAAGELELVEESRLKQPTDALKQLPAHDSARLAIAAIELGSDEFARYLLLEDAGPMFEALCKRFGADTRAELALMAHKAGLLPSR